MLSLYPAQVGFFLGMGPGSNVDEEAGDILFLESPVATHINAVCFHHAEVTPASEGVVMDVEKMGRFPYREHGAYFNCIYHILSALALSYSLYCRPNLSSW